MRTRIREGLTIAQVDRMMLDAGAYLYRIKGLGGGVLRCYLLHGDVYEVEFDPAPIPLGPDAHPDPLTGRCEERTVTGWRLKTYEERFKKWLPTTTRASQE